MNQENSIEDISDEIVFPASDETAIASRQGYLCLAFGLLALVAEIVPLILLLPIHHSFGARQQQLLAVIAGPLLPLMLLALFASACTSIVVGHVAHTRPAAPRGSIAAGLSFAYIALALLVLLLGWNLLRHHI